MDIVQQVPQQTVLHAVVTMVVATVLINLIRPTPRIPLIQTVQVVVIVLVTPSFLKRVQAAGMADKELSALLACDLLVPIIHNTTFEELREVSPLLGSRSGLSTKEDSMDGVAGKLAELVAPETLSNTL